MTLYCTDDEHGRPCPLPCPACEADGCDPADQVEADSPREAARLAGWSEEYIAEIVPDRYAWLEE